MIKSVTITSKGDYSEMGFHREPGSTWIDMSYKYYNGCSYASFKLEDLKQAIKILEDQEDE